MKIITTQQLKRKIDAGTVALFDVRGDVEYEMAHIPGAKTAPLGSLVFRVASVMSPDSEIVLYSRGNGCPMADEAAERLEGLRMKNILVYRDGMADWETHGHPVVASPNAKVIAQGPVIDCRPIIVDVENAYGGAFKSTADDRVIGGAGG